MDKAYVCAVIWMSPVYTGMYPNVCAFLNVLSNDYKQKVVATRCPLTIHLLFVKLEIGTPLQNTSADWPSI